MKETLINKDDDLTIMKVEREKLNEDHLESVFHENCYFSDLIENNKRFIFSEKLGDLFFHVIGYKKNDELYVYKSSMNKERKNYVEYFCETHKIELMKDDEYDWYYDIMFDSEIIITVNEVIGENFIVKEI